MLDSRQGGIIEYGGEGLLNEALTEFALKGGGKLRAHLTRLVGTNDAEDVYQQTFAKIIRANPVSVLKDGDIARYIWKTALRTADEVNVRKRREAIKSRHMDEWEELDDPTPSVSDQMEGSHQLAAIGEAVSGLSDLKRKAFLMRSAHNMSIKEIAKALGLSYRNTRYHLDAAAQTLSSELVEIQSGGRCDHYEDLIQKASLGGGLGFEDRVGLARHLAHCGSCRAYKRELSGVRKQVAAAVPFALMAASGAKVGFISTAVVKIGKSLGVGGGKGVLAGAASQSATVQGGIMASTAVKAVAVVAAGATVVGSGYGGYKAVQGSQKNIVVNAITSRAVTPMRSATPPHAVPGKIKLSSRSKKKEAAAPVQTQAVQKVPAAAPPQPSSTPRAKPSGGGSADLGDQEFHGK